MNNKKPKKTTVKIMRVILKHNKRKSKNNDELTDLFIKVQGSPVDTNDDLDFDVIKTKSDRYEIGTTIEVFPRHEHTFGDFVEEREKLLEYILEEVRCYANGDYDSEHIS